METSNIYHPPTDLAHVIRVQGDSIAHVSDLIHSIDYDAPIGTVVMASLAGIVTDTKDDSNIGGLEQRFEEYGNFVEITHENGESSEYEHLLKDSVTVKIGDRVEAGQKIAEVGNTGWSECPHLHFMVYPTDQPYKTKEIRFE